MPSPTPRTAAVARRTPAQEARLVELIALAIARVGRKTGQPRRRAVDSSRDIPVYGDEPLDEPSDAS